MAFSIELFPDAVPDGEQGEKACWGVITIGEFQERFVAPLTYWGAADYERHWKQAVGRIIESSAASCLITSMRDPATANFIFWWPVYRVGEIAFIQNHVLFLDDLSSPFDPDNPFAHVPVRETRTPAGEELSEWAVAVKDLESFYLRKWNQT